MAPQGHFVYNVKPHSRQLRVLLAVQEKMMEPARPKLVIGKNMWRIEKPEENEFIATLLRRRREEARNPSVVSDSISILSNALDREFAILLGMVENPEAHLEKKAPKCMILIPYEFRNPELIAPFIPKAQKAKNSKKKNNVKKVEVPMFKMNDEDFPEL